MLTLHIFSNLCPLIDHNFYFMINIYRSIQHRNHLMDSFRSVISINIISSGITIQFFNTFDRKNQHYNLTTNASIRLIQVSQQITKIESKIMHILKFQSLKASLDLHYIIWLKYLPEWCYSSLLVFIYFARYRKQN